MAEGVTRKKSVRHTASYYRRRAASLEKQAERAKAMAERKEKREYATRVRKVKAYRDSPAHRRAVLAGARRREKEAGRKGTFSLGVFRKPRKRRASPRKPGPRRPKKRT